MKMCRLASVAVVLSLSASAWGQVQFLGRVLHPRFPEATDKLPANTGVAENYFAPDRPGDPAEIMALTNVRCFASVDGPGIEAMAARTWEMAPTKRLAARCTSSSPTGMGRRDSTAPSASRVSVATPKATTAR